MIHWWMQLTQQGHPLGWFFSVTGRWYGFWSGLGITVAGPFVYFKHKNCHQKGCWRVGRHPDPEDASFVRCPKHHIEAGHGPSTPTGHEVRV